MKTIYKHNVEGKLCPIIKIDDSRQNHYWVINRILTQEFGEKYR